VGRQDPPLFTENSSMSQVEELLYRFKNRYGRVARIYRAPGRVNLIGEHTDYNEGFVMPAAIDLSTWVAVAPRSDRKICVYSENLSEAREVLLDGGPTPGSHWSDYVFGVAAVLEQSGHRLSGADLLVHSEVPIGAGLSSSAAIEVAVGYSLLQNAGLSIDRTSLARICQRAENEFVGARCGIMDQFIASYGQYGKALMLDCRSLDFRLLPLPPRVRMVICNTMIKHALADGEYNRRRAECESAVQRLSQSLPGARALRDLTPSDLEQRGSSLPQTLRRRCRHVISENGRVAQAARALEQCDMERFGQLMSESHRSLRDDYEVSCPELDLMVKLAAEAKGVYGARMTGGGFGGCTVNLVQEESVNEFVEHVLQGYKRVTLKVPGIYVCSAAKGVEEVHLS